MLKSRRSWLANVVHFPILVPQISRSAPAGRISSSRQSGPLPLEPRTYSAAQRWLRRNPGQEELANKVGLLSLHIVSARSYSALLHSISSRCRNLDVLSLYNFIVSHQVLRQTGRSEVDKLLENTLQPNAKKAVREWLKTATEAGTVKFFVFMYISSMRVVLSLAN